MKTKFIKRGMSGLMAVLMAVTAFVGLGTTTAFAASETAESYMVSYPRDGDANQVYGEDGWGHTAKTYMNGCLPVKLSLISQSALQCAGSRFM